MIRSYAAFVQNTVHPSLDKIKDILDLADEKGVPLKEVADKVVTTQLFIEFLRALTHIIIAVLICYTAYKVI